MDERDETECVVYRRGDSEENKVKGAISKVVLNRSRVCIELEVHFRD